MSLERKFIAEYNLILSANKSDEEGSKHTAEQFSKTAIERINADLNKHGTDLLSNRPRNNITVTYKIQNDLSKPSEDNTRIVNITDISSPPHSSVTFYFTENPSASEFNLGTIQVTFKVNEKNTTEATLAFTNSELCKILDGESIEKEQLQRAAAEQALRDALKKHQLNELIRKRREEKLALTLHNMLVLAIGEALEVFVEKKSYPWDYTEAFQAMSKLLDDPSIENCKLLLDIAPYVKGHRCVGEIFYGISLLVMSCMIASIPWFTLLITGGFGVFHDPVVAICIALIVLPVAVYGVALAYLGRLHDQSAELYKVEAAAKELCSPQVGFDSFFSADTSTKKEGIENVANNTTPFLEEKVTDSSVVFSG